MRGDVQSCSFAGFERNADLEQPRQHGGLAPCGPQLELGVARAAQSYHKPVGRAIDSDRRDDLRVASVQALGQPDERRKKADGPPGLAAQRIQSGARFLRRPLAVEPGCEGDRLDFSRFEPPQVAMLD